jgi:hypothetical protein
MRGSSPQCVVSHLPNIATLRRGTHFSTCTDVVRSWRTRLPALNEVPPPVLPLTAWVGMFYFMESATLIIFFARLVHTLPGGRGGCEEEYSLCACDNEWWKRWTAPYNLSYLSTAASRISPPGLQRLMTCTVLYAASQVEQLFSVFYSSRKSMDLHLRFQNHIQ